LDERQQLVNWIQEAMTAGARIKPCCDETQISLRTYRRWVASSIVMADKRPIAIRPVPSNKLSEEEISKIHDICHQPEYANLPPSQIVPRLADKGVYIASESSFYRILKQHEELHHRGRAKAPHQHNAPTTYTATAPKELWSWDITYFPSRVKGHFFYLYMIIDIFSRKIVGHEVHEQENGVNAAKLLERTMLLEQVYRPQSTLVLHSDNGAPMKSYTFKAKLEALGIVASYSRPRVSNDNPFIESLFRTVKYNHLWPSRGFESITEARKWVKNFVAWYNTQHLHSQIGFITPNQKHEGLDTELMANRKKVYTEAKQKKPERWSKDIRNWKSPKEVYLNPDKQENRIKNKVA